MVKKTRFPSEQTIQVSIPSFEKGINTIFDESISSLSIARDIKNFSYNDGTLKNGIGFNKITSYITNKKNADLLDRDLSGLNGIVRVFLFYIFNKATNQREDKLIFISNDLKIFYINLYEENPSLKSIRDIQFSSIPVATQYRLSGEDVFIFSSETDNMVVWNGQDPPYEVLDAPKISSMTVHYERLFVTVDGEKNAIWFSDDLDPTNWSINLDDAGFIELCDERGALLKVVSFYDYVYIFREYGISRLSAYGNQKNFAISNLFVSSGKIIPDSVCVCGDKILFMASDGLYRFDGINTYKILDNISKNIINIPNQNASACFYNGNYYLACKYNFFNESNTSETFNTILEIDVDSYKLKNLTYGVNICYLCAINNNKFNGVIALTNNETNNNFSANILDYSGTYLGLPLYKEWTSSTNGIDNTYNLKTLKKIYIETIKPVILKIFADEKEFVFHISSSNKITKRVNIPLYNFRFQLVSTTDDCKIKNIKFLFSSVKGRE